MKRWLPWVLLAVSLALNIFFVAGFFWTRSAIAMWHDPERRVELVADRLDLTEPQRAQFRQAMEALKSKGFPGREGRRQMRREIIDMALKPDPDRAAILARMETISRERVQSMAEALDIMLPFLATLTPEQRTELRELIEQRRRGWGGPWLWGHRLAWTN
ncbi:MAG TPA: Spy/CpxP family protein refolding chaperone [Alphaproteobacteria bacterium]|nr:Spy/CpxP family protein refolding chaperone [Alphaproteobacteria bacterium]